jgi:uncharacterized protein (TIGR02145 family)
MLFSVAVFAQEKDSFTDTRDKKTYKTVKIGEQIWMAENLNHHGEDGFLGLCYGDEPKKKIRKPENCKKYGRLYDWSEAMKACHAGWHLPTREEWQKLSEFSGGDDIAGKKLKAKSGWEMHDFSKESPKTPKCKWKEELIDDRGRTTVVEHDKCSTDEHGFAALPGGYSSSGGSDNDVGSHGRWWSASEDYSSIAYYRYMSYNDEGAGWNSGDKDSLLSVRCVQDKAQVSQ